MKKLIFAVFAFFSIIACKTQPSQSTPPPPPPKEVNEITTDANVAAGTERGVLMKNGVMMTMQNGESVPMTSDMTLENGDKVLMNGEIIHKDGSKTKMQEGMIINNSGTMMDQNGKMIEPNR